jgi:hypothetical protein
MQSIQSANLSTMAANQAAPTSPRGTPTNQNPNAQQQQHVAMPHHANINATLVHSGHPMSPSLNPAANTNIALRASGTQQQQQQQQQQAQNPNPQQQQQSASGRVAWGSDGFGDVIRDLTSRQSPPQMSAVMKQGNTKHLLAMFEPIGMTASFLNFISFVYFFFIAFLYFIIIIFILPPFFLTC